MNSNFKMFNSTEPNNTKYFVYNLPKTNGDEFQKSKGSCGNGTTDQNILIEWLVDDQPNSLNLTFRLNQTSTPKEFSLHEAVFNLSANIVPNNNQSFIFYRVGSVFDSPKERSYHCTRDQVANLTDSETSSNVVATVTVSHVQLEAYHSGQSKKYSSAIDCDAINTPGMNLRLTQSRHTVN